MSNNPIPLRRIRTFLRSKRGVAAVLMMLMIVTGPLAFSKETPQVTSLPKPDYKGIQFIRDVRIVDLRHNRPIPDNKRNEKYSPVTWTHLLSVKKRSADVKTVVLEYLTSGVDLDARCLTHTYELRRSEAQEEFHGKTIIKITVHVVVHIDDAQVDEEVLIINEATYWNAFTGEHEEWAGMLPKAADTETMGIILLFPESKPVKSYEPFVYPRNTTRPLQPARNQAVMLTENNRLLRWVVKKPNPQYAYDIVWKW